MNLNDSFFSQMQLYHQIEVQSEKKCLKYSNMFNECTAAEIQNGVSHLEFSNSFSGRWNSLSD